METVRIGYQEPLVVVMVMVITVSVNKGMNYQTCLLGRTVSNTILIFFDCLYYNANLVPSCASKCTALMHVLRLYSYGVVTLLKVITRVVMSDDATIKYREFA